MNLKSSKIHQKFPTLQLHLVHLKIKQYKTIEMVIDPSLTESEMKKHAKLHRKNTNTVLKVEYYSENQLLLMNQMVKQNAIYIAI